MKTLKCNLFQSALFILLIINTSTFGQNITPRKQWEQSFGYSSFQTNESDHINKIIQAPDGRYFGVGASERYYNGTKYYQPSLSIVNVDGSIASKYIYTDGSPAYPGEFYDVIVESNRILLVGIKENPTTGYSGVFIVSLNNNLNVVATNWYTENNLVNYALHQPNQHLGGRVQMKLLSPSTLGFVLSVSSIENMATIPSGSDIYSTMRGAMIIRIDYDLTITSSAVFGSHSGGWEIYKGDQTGTTNYCSYANDICINYNQFNFPDGFIVTGSIKETPTSLLYRNVLLIKCDNLGSTTSGTNYYINTFSEVSLTGIYSDIPNDDAVCYTSNPNDNDTGDERGYHVIQEEPGGNFSVFSAFDYYINNNINCPSLTYTASFQDYYDFDVAKTTFSQTGGIISSSNPTRFSTINPLFDVKYNDANAYIICGNVLNPTSSYYSVNYFNTSGSLLWSREFKGVEQYINSLSSCSFTQDNGIIIAGFNQTSSIDNHIIKLRYNCQMIAASNPINWDLYNGITISTNTTWSSSMKIKGIVEIASGASLTINNSALIEFANSNELNDFNYLAAGIYSPQTDGNTTPTYINVKPGGKLILTDNCRLTGLKCDRSYMWDGIILSGNSGASQLPESQQGVIEFNNGASIEDARYGILLSSHKYNDFDGKIEPVNLDAGGILKSKTKAKFSNCLNSVYFAPYTDPVNPTINRSRFFDTYFESTHPTFDLDNNSPAYNNVFISLNEVHGIVIEGCLFTGIGNSIGYSGKGISSYDSDFVVDRRGDWLDFYGNHMGAQCRFQNLNTAIDVYNSFLTPTFMVKGSVFSGNIQSITVHACTGFQVLRNVFRLAAVIIPQGYAVGAWGVTTENCTLYRIEENNFLGDGSFDNQAFGYGVATLKWNYNSETDVIYNNRFDQLTFACFSAGLNAGTGLQAEGLKYVCNDFTNNVADIYVYPNNSWGAPYIMGISKEQGDVNNPAANTFDNCDQIPEHIANFSTDAWIIDYFFCNPSDLTDPQGCSTQTNEWPLYINYDKETLCPSMIDVGDPHGEKRTTVTNGLIENPELKAASKSITNPFLQSLSINERILSHKIDGVEKEYSSLGNNLITLSERRHLEKLIHDQNFLSAQSFIANNILTKGDQYKPYADLVQTIITLKSRGLDIQAIKEDPIALNKIWCLAADSSLYGSESARSVLKHVFGAVFPESYSPTMNTELKDERVNSKNEIKISAFPTPFSDELNIILESNEKSMRFDINITDVLGRVIYQSSGFASDQTYTLNTTYFHTGLYNITISTESGDVYSQKVLKSY